MSEPEKVNILMVDDRPENLAALESILGDPGENLIKASSGDEALRVLLKEEVAVILLDVQMPGMDGFETAALIRARERSRNTPIIFVTAIGKSDEQIRRGYKLGAVDYIVKPFEPVILRWKVSVFVNLFRLTRELKCANEELQSRQEEIREANEKLEERVKEKTAHLMEEIAERRRAEDTQKESEEKFRLIFENANDGILLADTESMEFQMGNRRICEMLGYGKEEILGLRLPDIHPEKDLPGVLAEFQSGVRGEAKMASDIPLKRKDGSVFFAEISSSSIAFQGKQFLMGIFRDLTRERMLQKQIETAQRMEAVGTLAGGIAHDFNNALTGIFGFAEMVKITLSGNERALSDVNEILHCAERASTLTRQLLTYARRQIIDPVNLSLNKVITDLMKLVSKAVGEHIEIRPFLAKDLPAIRADVGQIEQVVMNLVLNARDAMPGGGQLLIETGLVHLDAEYVRYHPYMKVGSYVVLTVSDTGAGMDQKTRERVFEPFFTTKGPDKGTGLGLAMVYGIVKQHGGFIHLYSEPGKGTSFKIYLPPVEGAPDVVVSSKPSEIRGGTETVLLAEDNESVRMLVERTLMDLGYTVLVARNGEEAVEAFQKNRDRIDLAILDVVMPKKGGKEACEEMRKARADLKVMFMSGYTANAVHESFILIAGIPFLSKPFGPGALARKVREVLDGGEAAK